MFARKNRRTHAHAHVVFTNIKLSLYKQKVYIWNSVDWTKCIIELIPGVKRGSRRRFGWEMLWEDTEMERGVSYRGEPRQYFDINIDIFNPSYL